MDILAIMRSSYYEFKVDKFSAVKEKVNSEEISPIIGCYSRWKVNIHIDTKTEGSPKQDQMSIALQRLDNANHTAKIDVVYNLKNTNGTIITSDCFMGISKNDFESAFIKFSKVGKPSNKYGIQTKIGDNMRLCEDDTLHVLLFIKTISSCACSENQNYAGKINAQQCHVEKGNTEQCHVGKVHTVRSYVNQINTVLRNAEKINTVQSNAEKINTVQSNAEKINTVQSKAEKINTVQSNAEKNTDSKRSVSSVTPLILDLLATFGEQQFTDVVFRIENESILAHKFILCARSPVFAKMFENDLQEKASNLIEIVDSSIEDIVTFLTFLYTGTLKYYEVEKIINMYTLADKYDVISLRDSCRQVLCDSLSESNACVILNLADLHSDEKMEQTTIDFICKHFDDVERTDDWQNLVDIHPRLALKVTLHLTKLSRCKKTFPLF